MLLDNVTSRIIMGWGIYDCDRPYSTTVNVGSESKRYTCPYFRKWHAMLIRTFSKSLKDKYPSHIGTTICDDWKYFSNFKSWIDCQPNRRWENLHMDKDLLVIGNKQYSPSTVVFIDQSINNFIVNKRKEGGTYMLGVTDHYYGNKLNPFMASCRNPFTKKRGSIGYFKTELEAHKAWQAKKHEYACQLADLQDDPRVADALRQRYAPDKDWSVR